MPHVLYNHITHCWDRPDPDDGGSDLLHPGDESPQFSPLAQRVLPPLALGSATVIAGLVLLGLVAGVLLGVG